MLADMLGQATEVLRDLSTAGLTCCGLLLGCSAHCRAAQPLLRVSLFMRHGQAKVTLWHSH